MNGSKKGIGSHSLLLIIVLLFIALIGIGSAQAKADTFTVIENSPLDIIVHVPCANGGVGEDVHLTGTLHSVFHVTTTSSGSFRISISSNPQGVSGVGLTTGAIYQGTGITRNDSGGRLGFETTFVNNVRIIGQGTGNNFLVHGVFHITLSPDGTVTSFHDSFSVECK